MSSITVSLNEEDAEALTRLSVALNVLDGSGRESPLGISATNTIRAAIRLSLLVTESGIEIPNLFPRGVAEEKEKLGRATGPVDKERAAVIGFLRNEMGWSLQRIGKNFGISRERVRQIVGNTGWVESVERNDLIEAIRTAEYGKTNQEVADELGVSMTRVSSYRAGLPKRIANEESKGRIGQVWEEWAAEILTNMGMACQLMPPKNRGYDLVANGRKIDVKVARSGKISPSLQGRLINPPYSFGTDKIKGETPIDFYLFIIAESKDVFVIPYEAVSPGTMRVKFCWPSARPDIGKYQKYHNRFDLLKATD